MRMLTLLVLELLMLCSLARAQGALEVALPGVVTQGSATLTLTGRNLRGVEVRLGGQALRVASTEDSLVRLELPSNLPAGEYPLSVSSAETQIRTEQGLLVLPGERSTKGGEIAPIEAGRALLLTSPGQYRRLEGLWKQAGFAQEFRLNPFLPASEGVCGQVLVGLQDLRGKRSTAQGMQALVGALYREGGFRIAGRLIMRGPAGAGLAQPTNTPPAPTLRLQSAPGRLRVALLDTGWTPFEPLSTRVDLEGARSFVNLSRVRHTVPDQASERSPSGALLSGENVGHGTPVGVRLLRSTGASLLPLQVCDADGACSTSSLLAGICYAASLAQDPTGPVRILNLSLSGEEHQPLVYEALQVAAQRGISIVIASGNQRREDRRAQPLSFPAHYSVPYPTSVQTWPPIPGLIAVGSLGANGQPSSFSSAGPWVTVSALGENLSLPRADGRGNALVSGTSFAAPRVSAWIAERLERDPSLSPVQVKAQLLEAVIAVPGCPLERCGWGQVPEDP